MSMLCCTALWALAAISLEPITPPTVGRCAEFRLQELQDMPGNPFDPDSIRLDIRVTPPAGPALATPCFWKQDFTRALANNVETRTPDGAPGWRWRYTPAAPGAHQWTLTRSLSGQPAETVATGAFEANAAPDRVVYHGPARVDKQRQRGFQFADGAALTLYGANLCWAGARGARDYDDWLGAFAAAGMNYTRLWMSPYGFGVETRPEDRLHYNLETAWMLDYVLELAAAKEIQVMLCLDFHGMFQDKPDMWGGNNFWPKHPYNQANGGPCARQNDFFTLPEARALYEKRLRYLVARYGAYPSLFCWEFFNEINLVYNKVNHTDVRRWHAGMAAYLRGIDPWRHPATTSFAGSWDDKPTWRMEGMDFAQYHLYLDDNKKGVAEVIGKVANRFAEDYHKPLVIGEYGVTSRNDGRDIDPYFRGLRQGLWSGLMAGAAGAAMPWWWECLHEKQAWGQWTALKKFAETAGVTPGAWRPLAATAKDAAVLALTDGSRAALYVVDRRYHYPEGARVAEPEDCETMVTLRGLPAARYAIHWWDSAGGREGYKGAAGQRDGAVRCATPTFKIDAAAWLVPE